LSGNRIFPVSTNLKIKKELGKVFKAGANFRNLSTQPHTFPLAAQDPITFRYRTQTGAEGSDITDINPGIYDVNGTITAMPATATLATIQRIFIFQDGLIRIQLGQRFFNNLNEAITAINSDVFITDSDISENGLYLGAIVMIRGTTNLSLLSQAVFVPSSGVSANGSTSAAPLGYTAENAANKQNSLAADGTGAKYPTIDAIRTPTFATSVTVQNEAPIYVFKNVAGTIIGFIEHDGGTLVINSGGFPIQTSGDLTIQGDTKITDLAGSGNRNVSAAASGILVINTFYSVFADNAAAIAGGLQIGEFYRTSTGALFVRF
jgi:hypothetical protein